MTTTTTLDKPVKAPTFRHVSTGRRIRNNIATGLITLCFAIALIPLVWVLWMVISKGIEAIVAPEWWTNSQKGVLPDQTAAWCVPRDLRHHRAVRGGRDHRGTARHHGRDLPGRIRPRPSWPR